MKIGFKNFKKFQDFPMIELAPITFLVGPNNSGKSSFIKALTFLLTNLKNQKLVETRENLDEFFQVISLWINEVSFHHMTLSHLGFGDFSTCLNDADGSRIISFQVEDDGDIIYEFSFGASEEELSHDPSLLLQLPVKSWRTTLKKQVIDINMYFKNDNWHIAIAFDKNEWLPYIIKRLDEIKSKAASGAMDIEVAKNIISTEERLISNLSKDLSSTGIVDYTVGSPDNSNSLLIQAIWHAIKHENIEGPAIGASDIEYIETHNANHSQVLLADNKNDYLARTIVEFFKTIDMNENSINPSGGNDRIYRWCRKWMREFGIGESFKINPLAGGEAFTVNIRKTKHQTGKGIEKGDWVNLATLGTGAIQLFILILRIGLAMSKLKYHRPERRSLGKRRYVGNIPIIIEEPEQNLHPAFQSKLADLFKDAYEATEGCITFVVETHSEYIIRHTQVMVARGNDDKGNDFINPFRVYYFPEKGLPYDMKYLPSGRFENNFGEGFFDQTARWHMEIIRRENARK